MPELIKEYIDDENLLATLAMEKKIKGFDFDNLHHCSTSRRAFPRRASRGGRD